MATLNLKFSECGYGGRRNSVNGKNEVFEYLIEQLRQQVNNNRCEDLAHEVRSLKNQLRDASAQIKELHIALAKAAGDVEAYKLAHKGGYISAGQSYVVGEHGPEQSGRRKEDAQDCYHNWRFVNGKAPAVCINCGVTKPEECEHTNTVGLRKGFATGFTKKCLD